MTTPSAPAVNTRIRPSATATASAGALTLLLLLTGCSPLDGEPVPTEQTAGPWACDGVSRVSIERIVGNPSVPYQSGDWRTLSKTGFTCKVDSPNGTIDIVITPYTDGDRGAKAAERMNAWQQENGHRIEGVSAPGEGYVGGEPGERIVAGWSCTDRSVEVTLDSVYMDDRRDQLVDSEHLLVSLLPFACQQREVPDVDYGAGRR